MRRIVTLMLLSVCGVTGCQSLTGDHAHHGWFVGAWKPSSVDQQGVTLINQNPGITSANPMGTISGPVSDAQSNHLPTVPAPVPVPAPMPRQATIRSRIGASQICDPCQPPTLTMDQWMKINGAFNAKPMPRGD